MLKWQCDTILKWPCESYGTIYYSDHHVDKSCFPLIHPEQTTSIPMQTFPVPFLYHSGINLVCWSILLPLLWLHCVFFCALPTKGHSGITTNWMWGSLSSSTSSIRASLLLRADPRGELHIFACGIFANFCKPMLFFAHFCASERA